MGLQAFCTDHNCSSTTNFPQDQNTLLKIINIKFVELNFSNSKVTLSQGYSNYIINKSIKGDSYVFRQNFVGEFFRCIIVSTNNKNFKHI